MHFFSAGVQRDDRSSFALIMTGAWYKISQKYFFRSSFSAWPLCEKGQIVFFLGSSFSPMAGILGHQQRRVATAAGYNDLIGRSPS